MIIRMADIVDAGHCGTGARRWFHNHGLDFHDFMKNGIDADLFVEKGDDLALGVVEKKREREGG